MFVVGEPVAVRPLPDTDEHAYGTGDLSEPYIAGQGIWVYHGDVSSALRPTSPSVGGIRGPTWRFLIQPVWQATGAMTIPQQHRIQIHPEIRRCVGQG
ncbi:hypothetical protein GCM10009753_46860 [Streptantibioticus ferralitis]